MARFSVFMVALAVAIGVYFIPSPLRDPHSFIIGELPDDFDMSDKRITIMKAPKTQIIYKNKMEGPESFTFDSTGRMYVSLLDGTVRRSKTPIDPTEESEWEIISFSGSVNNATYDPKLCGTYDGEPICGRPLGIRLDKNEDVIVIDGYFGPLKIDKAGNKTVRLMDQSPRFGNDLALGDDGTIYFTDSGEHQRRDYLWAFLESKPVGKLMSLNPKTKESKVLLDDLSFANGVEVSPDQDYLLVVEMTKARVLKYWLKGSKAGTREIFADNLPAFPDNIRWDHALQIYWIGTSTKRTKPFSLVDFLSDKPNIRTFMTKILPGWLIQSSTPKYGVVIGLDKEGKIVKLLLDPTGEISFLSEAESHNGYLYIGSFKQPFLVQHQL